MAPSPASLSPTFVTSMEFPAAAAAKRMRPTLTIHTPSSGPSSSLASSPTEDDINAELAKLESLRKNVKQNLTLRPLKSSSPVARGSLSPNQSSPPLSATRITFRSADASAYRSNSSPLDNRRYSSGSPTSPRSGGSSPMFTPLTPSGQRTPHSPFDIISHYARNDTPSPPTSPLRATISPQISFETGPRPIAASQLFDILDTASSSSCSSAKRPLLLDTRPTASYLASRIRSGINLAIPTLILKRYRKYMTTGTPSLSSLHTLKGFVTTTEGQEEWDRLLGPSGGSSSSQTRSSKNEKVTCLWNGDVIVYDQEMDASDPLAAATLSNPNAISPSAPVVTSWLLLSVLTSLQKSNPGVIPGRIYWLEGGVAAAQEHSNSPRHFTNLDTDKPSGGGSAAPDTTENTTSAIIKSSPPMKTSAPVDSPSSAVDASRSLSGRSLGTIERNIDSHAVEATDTGLADGVKRGGAQDVSEVNRGPGIRRPGLSNLVTDVAAISLRSDSVPAFPLLPPSSIMTIETSSTSSSSTNSSRAPSFSSSSSSPPPLHTDLNTPSHDPSPPPYSTAPPRLPRLDLTTSSMLSIASPSSATPAGQGGPSHHPIITSYGYAGLLDMSPSPSPSTTTGNLPYPRTPTASRSRSNTGMLPKLGKLDTKSREKLTIAPINTTNLPSKPGLNNAHPSNPSDPSDYTPLPPMPPKLSLRTIPIKAATLAAPISSPKVGGFGLRLNLPPSPSRTAFGGAGSSGQVMSASPILSPVSGTSVFFTPVQTPTDFNSRYPFTPAESSFHSQHYQYPAMHMQLPPPSPTTPLTARPPPSPSLTSESESLPTFSISTVLPNFLFLGPELTTPGQVEELRGYGVQRILNMAMECDAEDYGLSLKTSFDRYLKVPMRDNIEEDRVTKGLKDVCEFIDDARLHSSPVYVHCKAGKSRSVTAVMAYLIHANHWPLSRAYAFVMDRRKGVSPNIGFVSELMKFEESELGGKSVGVVPNSEVSGDGGAAAASTGLGRRPAHARDSLPPAFHHSQSVIDGISTIGVPVSAGGIGGLAVGAGAGEEMEIKDGEGRYRHARRAPVNEQTLQPLRRVSKAGLEGSWV